jgi:acetolactate synthase-1/2/3 large subunit
VVVKKTADFQAARKSGLPSIIQPKIDPDAILPAATLSGIRKCALEST